MDRTRRITSTIGDSSRRLGYLNLQRDGYLRNSLANSTWSTYNVGMRKYIRFCSQLHFPVWPLRENILELFVTSLAPSLSYKTIKVYLCGVQAYARIEGLGNAIAEMPRLPCVLRGIRRAQGDSFNRPPRCPITLQNLRTLLDYLSTQATPANCAMLACACTMAFFGMLRVSEYTCPSSTRFDANTNLLVNDVSINVHRSLAYIKIKASKTDPFRQGAIVKLGVTGTAICPVQALLSYLRVRRDVAGPLFVFSNGHFLTRRHISTAIQGALGRDASVDTHSLRIGGASALAAANTPAYVIQILGRWKSDAFLQYLRFPDDRALVSTQIMAVDGTK